MANVVTLQTLLDGPRNLVVKVVGVLDTANLSDELIVDISGYTPVPTQVRIDKLWYSMGKDLTAILEWDASADVPIVAVSQADHPGWVKIGGLTNNSGSGKTGDILLTTLGYSSGSVAFSLVLWMVKEFTRDP